MNSDSIMVDLGSVDKTTSLVFQIAAQSIGARAFKKVNVTVEVFEEMEKSNKTLNETGEKP